MAAWEQSAIPAASRHTQGRDSAQLRDPSPLMLNPSPLSPTAAARKYKAYCSMKKIKAKRAEKLRKARATGASDDAGGRSSRGAVCGDGGAGSERRLGPLAETAAAVAAAAASEATASACAPTSATTAAATTERADEERGRSASDFGGGDGGANRERKLSPLAEPAAGAAEMAGAGIAGREVGEGSDEEHLPTSEMSLWSFASTVPLGEYDYEDSQFA